MQRATPIRKMSAVLHDHGLVERVELVVFVSLTHERTVYFTT